MRPVKGSMAPTGIGSPAALAPLLSATKVLAPATPSAPMATEPAVDMKPRRVGLRTPNPSVAFISSSNFCFLVCLLRLYHCMRNLPLVGCVHPALSEGPAAVIRGVTPFGMAPR